MAELIIAIESVVALPAYQQRVLLAAPASAQKPLAARSVFFGYDFHLAETGPRLIEINTNAGGGLLNTLLMAHGKMRQPKKSSRLSSICSARNGV
jgi:hypothetical protein